MAKLSYAQMVALDPVRGLNVDASKGRIPNDSLPAAEREFLLARRAYKLLNVIKDRAAAAGTGKSDELPLLGCDKFVIQTTGNATAFSFTLKGSIDGETYEAIGAAITANGITTRGNLGETYAYVCLDVTDAPDSGTFSVHLIAMKG